MKRFFPYIVLFLSAIFLLFYAKKTEEFVTMVPNNHTLKPLEITFGSYLCSECAMMIKKYKFSSQVIMPNKNTYFFDDIGCMIRWLNKQDEKKNAKIFVYTLDTRKYIDPKYALFSRIESTPLGYGFGAYEAKEALSKKYYFDFLVGMESYEIRLYPKDKYTFKQIQLYVLRGETLLNPLIKKHLFKGINIAK